MQIKCVEWTGNGSSTRSVTGVGFQPDFVLLKRRSGRSGGQAILWSSTLPSGYSKVANDAIATNLVKSANSDGFVVGSDNNVNESGAEYHAICLKAHASDLKVSSYTGNGSDSRSITGVGFQPDVVVVLPEAVDSACFRCDTHSGDDTSKLGGEANASNLIQSFISDGFTVGTSANVNGSGKLYHYIAWKKVTGFAGTIGYTGNGSDSRRITGSGFDPDVVFIKAASTSVACFHPHTIGRTTDLSLVFGPGTAAANYIQELIADGYELGSGSYVNSNDVVYKGFKFKEGNTQTGAAAGVTRATVVGII